MVFNSSPGHIRGTNSSPSLLGDSGLFSPTSLLPPKLQLKHVKYPKHSQVYATGRSSWDSGPAQPGCKHELPVFHQRVQIPVALRNPTLVSVAATPDPQIHWESWFVRGGENYLAVLALAWAYILSTRWVEIMPEATVSLVYTNSKAGNSTLEAETSTLQVDIGDASPNEARWCSCARCKPRFAGDSGNGRGHILLSLVSTAPAGLPVCTVNKLHVSDLFCSSPSFSEALRFLDNFCVRRNIVDQSHTALSAVLLFPAMGTAQGLQLPAFTPSHLDTPAFVQQLPHLSQNLNHTWAHQTNHLDRLLTLRSHAHGIRPLLLSTFYDLASPCNAVNPHLQGTLAVLIALSQNNSLVLAHMLMARQPKLAPLWLNATVLSLQNNLLRDAGWRWIAIELHSAAWTGTVQSFIQRPISTPLVSGPTAAAAAADSHSHTHGWVSLADQSRLLFLSRSGSPDRVPVCQWEPFDEIAVEDCDVEVRMHVYDGEGGCEGGTWTKV